MASTKRERLEAAIAGDVADRPPVALWRHFPVDDQHPETLAEATLAFQRDFDFDFVKISPASSFALKDWGSEDEWRASPEGSRTYTKFVLQSPDDWQKLKPRDVTQGRLGQQLQCLDRLQQAFGNETPYIQTIFSPLSQAKNLAGREWLLSHIHQNPQAVLAGLEVITQTTIAFLEAACARGIAGIFYAVQHASYQYFDKAGYGMFGEVFDRRVLEAANGLWLNVLHMHGEQLMFDIAATYPVQVVNWHDRQTAPDLPTGKAALSAAVCGGVQRWDPLVLGEPDAVRAQALQALDSVDGRGIVLSTGCVVPVAAPRCNLKAVREAVIAYSQ